MLRLYEDMSVNVAQSAMSKYAQVQLKQNLNFAKLQQQIQEYERARWVDMPLLFWLY